MRKGQAAMEFLMTYGWAILVVLAAIGALAYFGVLSPDKFLPDKCTASPPFSCVQYKVSAANGLYLQLSTNGGSDITINNLNVSCDGGTTTIAPTNASFSTSALVQNGNVIPGTTWSLAQLTGTTQPAGNCPALTTGAKFKADYYITYTQSGDTVSHDASGSIQARVE